MVTEKLKKDENSKKLTKRHISGGSITNFCPLFSNDGKILFVTWGKLVRAYSVQTGELIRDFKGLSGQAVAIGLHPCNNEYLVGLSAKGKLVQWSWESGHLHHTVLLKLPFKTCATGFHLVPELNSQKCFVYVTYKYPKKKYVNLGIFNELTGDYRSKSDGRIIKKFKLNDCPHNIAFGLVDDERYAAGIQDSKLRILDLIRKDTSYHRIGGERKLTCVTCHPKEKIIATGDDTGRVLLWYQFLDYSKKPVNTVYHWHTLPVHDIAFSHEGSYFYSGGEERVLVKWTTNSSIKTFLPRLPAPVSHISLEIENLFLAVSTSDNGILILDPQFKHQCFIQNFTCRNKCSVSDETNLFPCGLHFESRTKSLVTNGRVGHVQFFNPQTSSLLFNIDITGQNYLTQLRNTTVTNTDVTRIALTGDGMWMATVEERNDNETNLELRLKFWNFDTVTQSFFLNTSLEMPHTASILSVQFHPCNNRFAVTSGEDLKFRTWRALDIDSVYKKGIVWTCESVGFFRNLPVGDVAFSADGSLLGAGFDSTLTVWDPDLFQMKCSLSHCQLKTSIRHVRFGVLSSCHLVVVATCNSVGVWDLLTLTLVWVVPVSIHLLVADPLSDVMAAFTTSNDLFIFSPSSCKPQFSLNRVCPKKVNVLSAVFTPTSMKDMPLVSSWEKNSQLYYITSREEIFLVETEECAQKQKDNTILDVLPVTSVSNFTPFSALMAKEKISHVESLKPKTYSNFGLPRDVAVKELMKAPAQTMLSVSRLAESFLYSFVSRSEEKNLDSSDDENENTTYIKNDEDSDEEENNRQTVSNARNLLLQSKYLRRTDLDTSVNVTLEEKLSSILQEPFDWTSFLLVKSEN